MAGETLEQGAQSLSGLLSLLDKTMLESDEGSGNATEDMVCCAAVAVLLWCSTTNEAVPASHASVIDATGAKDGVDSPGCAPTVAGVWAKDGTETCFGATGGFEVVDDDGADGNDRGIDDPGGVGTGEFLCGGDDGATDRGDEAIGTGSDKERGDGTTTSGGTDSNWSIGKHLDTGLPSSDDTLACVNGGTGTSLDPSFVVAIANSNGDAYWEADSFCSRNIGRSAFVGESFGDFRLNDFGEIHESRGKSFVASDKMVGAGVVKVSGGGELNWETGVGGDACSWDVGLADIAWRVGNAIATEPDDVDSGSVFSADGSIVACSSVVEVIGADWYCG